MTIEDILARLEAEGYAGCHVARWDAKSIIVPGRGEVELAHGEAKLFDKKHAWPDYGGHQCFKDIDGLMADVLATWPPDPPECPEVEAHGDGHCEVCSGVDKV